LIYLDSSALVKLLFEEDESQALAQWLGEREEVPRITSELSIIELVRTCRRRHKDAVGDARQLLTGLDLVPMTRDLVEQATVTGPAELRTLDAVHLASALAVDADLSAFVAYDARLLSAARGAGLEVVAPT